MKQKNDFKLIKYKYNITAIIVGLFALCAILIVIMHTNNLYYTYRHGQKIKCTISEVRRSSKGGNSINIVYNEKSFNAGKCPSYYNVGDEIYVRYIEGKNNVVQERVQPWQFAVWFGLEILGVLIAIYCIILGILGKR